MITTAIAVNTDGATVLSAGATYGILLAILVAHGIVCSAATNVLARLNLAYVVVNGDSDINLGSLRVLTGFQSAQLLQQLSLYLSVQETTRYQQRMLSLFSRTTVAGQTVRTYFSPSSLMLNDA